MKEAKTRTEKNKQKKTNLIEESVVFSNWSPSDIEAILTFSGISALFPTIKIK